MWVEVVERCLVSCIGVDGLRFKMSVGVIVYGSVERSVNDVNIKGFVGFN